MTRRFLWFLLTRPYWLSERLDQRERPELCRGCYRVMGPGRHEHVKGFYPALKEATLAWIRCRTSKLCHVLTDWITGRGVMLVPDGEYLCPEGLQPPWRWEWARAEKKAEVDYLHQGAGTRYRHGSLFTIPKDWYRDRGWPVRPGESRDFLGRGS